MINKAEAESTLAQMLGQGVPKRVAKRSRDRDMLIVFAAASLAADRKYSVKQLNEKLSGWTSPEVWITLLCAGI